MDILTGSSQNFFVLIASFAFALFAAARAVESIRDFHQSPEDLRHLNLMLLQAVVILTIAILPLVLSNLEQGIQICSYISFGLSTCLLTHIIWSLVKRRIVFYYKVVSNGMVAAGILVTISYLVNAIYFASVLVYRLLLLIGFLFLCFRYYLVLGHFITHSNKKESNK